MNCKFKSIEERLKFKPSENSGVYFIKDLNNNTIKIGSSINTQQRFKEIKNTYSFLNLESNVSFLGCVEVDEYYKLESDLHKAFSNKRLKGEWFNLKFEDIVKELERIDLNEYIVSKKKKDIKDKITYLKSGNLNLRIAGEIEFHHCIVKDYATFNVTKEINNILIKNGLRNIDFLRYVEEYFESFKDDIIEEKQEIYVSDVFLAGVFEQIYKKIVNENVIENITDKIFCIFEC
ncbi:GIY-YIG nuclease family protein [Clostridium sp.]|uniref:GIY-YIG nuclease family protein n=1 Tax=Clostridium sp. TaxID=1506 RepID=UPI001D4B4D27|nr:GIY-YIG nuclease family protein [Clostridium sp.]MBS5307766.1 GIY-YIG nuclease family protein [Clostridium sp.]